MKVIFLILLASVFLASAEEVLGRKQDGTKKNITNTASKATSSEENIGAIEELKKMEQKMNTKIKKATNEDGRSLEEHRKGQLQDKMGRAVKVENYNVSGGSMKLINNVSDDSKNFTQVHKKKLKDEINMTGEEFTEQVTTEPYTNLEEADTNQTDEIYTEFTTIENYSHNPQKFERRSSYNDNDYFIEGEDDDSKEAKLKSQDTDRDNVKMVLKETQYKNIRTYLEQHNPKKFQRRTFDIWGMLGMGGKKNEDVVQITREIPVPVPYTVEKKIPIPVKVEVEHPIPYEVSKPYPVPVEKKVYYPVKEYVHAVYPIYKKVPYLVKIPVEKPVPIHISKPYPVYIEKKVPYPVEKHIPYPVKIPVDRPVPIHIPVVKNIYYPVEKKVIYPYPVTVEKPVAVPVEKPYPVYIEKSVPVETNVPYPISIEDHKVENTGSYSLNNDKFTDKANDYASPLINDGLGKTEVGFTPLVYHSTREGHDTTKLQKKKDETLDLTGHVSEEQDKPEEKHLTRDQSQEGQKSTNKQSDDTIKKDIKEFGRKIQKT